jgi:hypothetical protein
MNGIEDTVRRRAYELWEQAGQPEGRSEEFWFEAIAELEGKSPTFEERVEALGPPIVEPPGFCRPVRRSRGHAGGAHRRARVDDERLENLLMPRSPRRADR